MKAISLIGMPNMGKTYWAQALVEQGYRCIDCHEKIVRRLRTTLARDGFSGDIDAVAAWLGKPSEKRYHVNQRRYLEAETHVINQVLHNLIAGEQVVIDTTGSIIYLPSMFLQVLKVTSRIVYLKEPTDITDDMIEHFISAPKPVIWDNYYAALEGESYKETLVRCYPHLLSARSRKYRNLAHVVHPYEWHRANGLTAEEFLAAAYLEP